MASRVRATLSRSRLWAVQTPQVFRRAALRGAMRDADAAQLPRPPTTPG